MTSMLLAIAAMLAGTWIGAPTVTPLLVGALMGLMVRENPARRAALAGMLSWAAILLFATFRGDATGALAGTLGGAMGAPSWAIVVVTLLYPTILAASAAWLSHLVARRLIPSVGGRPARGITPT
jgi:hypothetical protein